MEQLFIPEKIKVGYQEREDTYTKKLAYVIYYDNKGVLRKEKSWSSWIDKGHDGREYNYKLGKYEINPAKIRGPLETHDFTNEPTSGFVLNKKAGGYSSGWNHRATYCRIFDPRGFEFEISIPNLLFIFQECNSFKGKGLEGEFVYAWQGKDLVLLPAHCDEYKKSKVFTKLQDSKISTKDLKEGYVYENKKQEKLIYLGKFDCYSFQKLNRTNEISMSSPKNKFFVFVNEDNDFKLLTSVTNIAKVSVENCVDNYADLVEKFLENYITSPPVSFVEKPFDFSEEEVNKNHYTYLRDLYMKFDNIYILYYGNSSHYSNGEKKYTPHPYYKLYFKNKKLIKEAINQGEERDQWTKYHFLTETGFISKTQKKFTLEEVKKMGFVNLYVTLENGKEIKL